MCAFNEVHPLVLRPPVLRPPVLRPPVLRPLMPPAGVLVEARLLPAVELPPQRRFLAGQFLWTLGRMLRARTALTGESG